MTNKERVKEIMEELEIDVVPLATKMLAAFGARRNGLFEQAIINEGAKLFEDNEVLFAEWKGYVLGFFACDSVREKEGEE